MLSHITKIDPFSLRLDGANYKSKKKNENPLSWVDPEGGTWGPDIPPWKITSGYIGCLRNTGTDLLRKAIGLPGRYILPALFETHC